MDEPEPSTQDQVAQSGLGWRFAAGITLIIGGYAAWSFIPLAVAADLHPTVKSGLAALLGATPFLTKVIAIALMGRPAYELFKRNVWKFVRQDNAQSVVPPLD